VLLTWAELSEQSVKPIGDSRLGHGAVRVKSSPLLHPEKSVFLLFLKIFFFFIYFSCAPPLLVPVSLHVTRQNTFAGVSETIRSFDRKQP
jgi:hypothetical protein